MSANETSSVEFQSSRVQEAGLELAADLDGFVPRKRPGTRKVSRPSAVKSPATLRSRRIYEFAKRPEHWMSPPIVSDPIQFGRNVFLHAASEGVLVQPMQDRESIRVEVAGGVGPFAVLVTIDQRAAIIVLPLSVGSEETSQCTLAVHKDGRRRRLSVILNPRRTVLTALRGLVESGKLGPGLDLAQQATELLEEKYLDPVGAAYGALILHRFGVLGERLSWVENLARDFAWMPDGRILLAALLMEKDQTERSRGLIHLLDATRGTLPIFSGAISLAQSLCRRWPRSDHAAGALSAPFGYLAELSEHLGPDETFSVIDLSVHRA